MKSTQKKGTENKRRALFLSLGLTVFSLVMPTIAGVIIGVRGVTDSATIFFIQFLAIFCGCWLTGWLVKKSEFTFKKIGFQKPVVGTWVIGLVAVEVVAFMFGISKELDGKGILILSLFMISVGFFEEVIYRGLILQYWLKVNKKTAILVSSCLFGLGHIANLLGGADLKLTAAQIVFAFLFGAVCAEIVLLTESLVLGIIWHTGHNIIDHLTNTPSSSNMQLLLVFIQCIFLGIVGHILWKQLFNEQKKQD